VNVRKPYQVGIHDCFHLPKSFNYSGVINWDEIIEVFPGVVIYFHEVAGKLVDLLRVEWFKAIARLFDHPICNPREAFRKRLIYVEMIGYLFVKRLKTIILK